MQLNIDSKFFEFSSIISAGLISQLKRLQFYGYEILADTNTISNEVLKVLTSEGISIKDKSESPVDIKYEDNKVNINGEEYTTIEEAVSSLLDRKATVVRNTKETKINIELNIDGRGKSKINTGIGFFDHMLEQISRHANFDLTVNVNGDLNVDEHHTVEDTGLALGESIKKCIGNKMGIKRYGFLLPMDDSIARCAIDLGGRFYLNYKCKFSREKVGDFPTELAEEFFKSVAAGMSATLYLRAKGKNDHHKIEAMFKAFAKALNEAVRYDDRTKNQLPSTKGVLWLE